MKRALLLSVALLVAGGVALATPSVQADVACPPNYADTTGSGVCLPMGSGLSEASTSFLLVTFMKWLLGIASILGVIAFVVSGVQYLTAAGDEDQAKTAKRNIQYAVIGIVVVLSGYIIITAIDQIFKGNPAF